MSRDHSPSHSDRSNLSPHSSESSGDRQRLPKVYVGHISPEASVTDIENVFLPFGKITRLDMKRGFAFIEFLDRESANEAIAQVNGTNVRGQALTVEWSNETQGKPQKPKPVPGEGRCFHCGETGHWKAECPVGPIGGRRRDDDRSFRHRDDRDDRHRDDRYRDDRYRDDRYRDRPRADDRSAEFGRRESYRRDDPPRDDYGPARGRDDFDSRREERRYHPYRRDGPAVRGADSVESRSPVRDYGRPTGGYDSHRAARRSPSPHRVAYNRSPSPDARGAYRDAPSAGSGARGASAGIGAAGAGARPQYRRSPDRAHY